MELKLAEMEKNLGSEDPAVLALKELREEEEPEKNDPEQEDLGQEDRANTDGEGEDNGVETPSDEDTDETTEEEPKKDVTDEDDVKPNPLTDELLEEAKSLGLDETATKEQIESKKEENEQIKREVEEYAIKKGISIEDSQKEFEKAENVLSKYSNNAKKIAFAQMHAERKISQLAEENKKLREQAEVKQNLAPDEMLVGEKIIKHSQLIEAYRKQYPKMTEEMEDGEVLERAKGDLIQESREIAEQKKKLYQRELKIKADTRAKLLIDNLPESAKRFLPEIRAGIAKLSPQMLAIEGFNLDGLVLMAKGKHAEEDIKEAYKKGLEDAKIKSVTSSVGSGKARRAEKPISLTPKQKKDMALYMPEYDPNNPKDAKEFLETFEHYYQKKK